MGSGDTLEGIVMLLAINFTLGINLGFSISGTALNSPSKGDVDPEELCKPADRRDIHPVNP